jgi:hypothetical protein
MTNRYPLIIDTLDSNKIKELPSGDNLNLTGNGVVGVTNITASGGITSDTLTANTMTLGGQTVKSVATSASYNDLVNAPSAVSDLTNDLNFVTTGANISVFTNNAGYLTTVAFADLTSKPTTLAGYGITDALTTGSNNSLLVNDSGYLKASDLQNGVITVDVNNTGDLVGSVFADDSTVMIDSLLGAINLDGTIRGNVIPANNATYNIGSASNKFSTVTANTFVGELKGSVFADDSTLLVDAVNGTIPGYVSIATLKAEVAASADFAAFKTRIAAL